MKNDKTHIGLSPDDLVHRGDKKVEEVSIQIIDFSPESLEEKAVISIDEVQKYRVKNTVSWLNIDGLHDTTIMKQISKVFDFETMVLAEVLNTESRPRVIEFDNCIFISIKMLHPDKELGSITAENLTLILTESVLISFQEQKGDVFDPVRDRIRKQKKRIRNSGTDYLAFALLDIVIDNYLYVLSLLGEKVEILEDTLLINPNEMIIMK